MGKFLRPAVLVLIILAGGAAGFSVGRFSRANVPAPSKPAWDYQLPQMSAEISPSYRAQIEETAVAVRAAMDAHPENPSAVSALALLYYLSHDRSGEQRTWERCLELEPTNALAHSRLVALAQQNADYGRIVALMEQALAREPNNGTYRGMLASALMYMNRPGEAREQLERSLVNGNNDAETFLLLGQVYNQLNRPEKARHFLTLTTDLAPHRPDALYELVKVCNKLGDTTAAKAYLRQFEELKAAQLAGEATREELQDEKFLPPRIAEIMTLVGKSYAEHDELDLAERYFEQAAAVSDTDIESRKMLVQVTMNAGRWREALQWVRDLRRLEPLNSVHHWNEGILCQRAGQIDEAEQIFRDYCRLRPAHNEGYASLAALFLQSNRKLNEARSLAERAVELEPSSRNYWLLGSVAHKQRDLSTARAALRQALELDPDNPELAKSYESLSKP